MVMIAMALRGGAKSKIGKARFGKCRLIITPPEFLKVRERRIFRKKEKIGGRGPTGPSNVKHLPTLKDSSKAVPMTKKGYTPFGEADLAAIVLASIPMLWQNQYNLNHSTVPKPMRTLLPDLEAIKRVMVEKKGANLKAKRKGSTAPSEAKGNPKHKASGGPTG